MAARRARNRPTLVEGHIERIGIKALQEFRQEVMDLCRGRHGVYALYKGGSLYYVGLANDLPRRLTHHLRDRHARKWNQFSLYLVRREHHIREMEALLIRIADPGGNKQKGRLKGAENLKRELRARAKKRRLQEVDDIFGRRRRRTNRRGGRVSRADQAEAVLSQLKGKRLLGWQGGFEYAAKVTREGWIRVGKYDYQLPSEAAMAALGGGRRVNGWAFWHFRRDGEWCPLRALK
jgi:hypothetical protein